MCVGVGVGICGCGYMWVWVYVGGCVHGGGGSADLKELKGSALT